MKLSTVNSPPILKPKRLKPGDTLGIVAPASPFDKEPFQRGLEALERMGFSCFLPEDLFAQNGYLAGGDEQRAARVLSFFKDPKIDGILCARGGYGSLRLLPLLDYDDIARHPKVFIGFSDVSVLLNVFSRRCGLICFHGPMVTPLHSAGKESADALLAAVAGEGPVSIQAEDPVAVRSGRVTAPVGGGNLTSLNHTLGTPYAPHWKGCILFIEDVGEAPYRIDRMLTQMRMAGVLEGVQGVAMGSFEGCGDMEEIYRIVDQQFSGSPIPILAGIPAGHGKKNLTLPVGLSATLDADAGTLVYSEAATIQ